MNRRSTTRLVKHWTHFINFFCPERLKNIKSLDDEHTRSLYFPSVSIIFPQVRKSFPSVLSKRVHPVSLREPNKSAQRKDAKQERTSSGNVSERSSAIVSELNNLQAKKRHSSVRIILAAHRINKPPVNNHLS